MKNSGIAFSAVVAASFILLSGCESEPASSRVTISPSSATIRKGESIEFTASGGYDYTWSLAEDTSGAVTYGVLSTRSGRTTIYTSMRSADADPVVRVLTVTSTIEGSDSTNSSPAEWTTQAYITHM